MKHLPILLGGILSLSASALLLRAQAPATPEDPFVKNQAESAAPGQKGGWQNCFMVLEIYALEKNDALSVIEGERGGAARYSRTTELAKAGNARLETLTALSGKGGQRAVALAIDEVRYPTEFSPPPDDKGIASPTAWETRNAGDTFEVEPVILADQRTCVLNLAPQHVTLAGFRDEQAGAGDAPVSQPIFHSQKLSTSASASSGEPLFLGTYTPAPLSADDPKSNEVWLAYLRIDLQGPPANEPKPAGKASGTDILQYEYSIYSLDRTAAHELLATPMPTGGAWEKLQALLNEKKAKFEHLTTITAKSGQRVGNEESREERYWTELSGGGRAAAMEETTRTVETGPARDPNQPANKKDFSKSTTTTENIIVRREDPKAPRTPAYVSAFETRDAGISVEVEPVVSPDGRSAEVNEVISKVTLMGLLKGTGVAEKYPGQPLFETRKLTMAQTVPIGVHVLAGTLNPPGADGVNDRADTGRTWLLFLRATPAHP